MSVPSTGKSGPQAPGQENGKDNILASLSSQLATIEKRDWELWLFCSLSGVLVAVGMLALLAPAAFFDGGDFAFQIKVSKELFFGLVAALIVFNGYGINRRLELRRTRQQLISTSIQSELTRLQSFTDPLTEVYNRRSLDEMAGRYISQARRQKKPLSFLLIDIDRFKQVNSRFGHLTGDLIIAEFAGLLKAAVRGSDAVVRYGGDEFLIILADTTVVGSNKVVERIGKYLEDWNRSSDLEGYHLSLSIGAAEWADGKTLDEVLDEADREMFKVKETATPAASAGTA